LTNVLTSLMGDYSNKLAVVSAPYVSQHPSQLVSLVRQSVPTIPGSILT